MKRYEGPLPSYVVRMDQYTDLVLTVDSSVANLCGSMAHPVWVLTERPGESDFRWQIETEKTNYFSSARVFRQGNDRKWKKPMRRAAEALREWRAEWTGETPGYAAWKVRGSGRAGLVVSGAGGMA
jgi:hypothetical protein